MSDKTDLVQVPQSDAIGANFTTASGFELMQRVSNMFSASGLVPNEYKNNVANCAIAIDMASRIGANPIQVMQNLHIIHGRPSWSSQFMIATFNKSGRFSPLRYEFDGETTSDEYRCRAYAVDKHNDEKLYGSWVSIALAKKEGWHGKSGSKWQTMPQQMLMYRAAAFFIRTYAPEIAMGLMTVEEISDIQPIQSQSTEKKTLDDLVVDGAFDEVAESPVYDPVASMMEGV